MAVSFHEGDAWLLWTIPKGGCDLEHILHIYVFIARDGIPPFSRVHECLSRATRAGILLPPSNGRYELASRWQSRFNQIVDQHSPTELGIMELDDFLVGDEWPELCPSFTLGEDEYRWATERVEQHYRSVFGSRS